MQGTAAGLRTDSAARLASLQRDRPEWKTWLALLTEIQQELEADHGARALGFLETSDLPLPAPDALLLQGQAFNLDARRLQQVVRRLTAVAARSGESGAASLRAYRPDRDEVVRLISAEIRQDRDTIAVIAAGAGLEFGPLASIAQLAALPVLHASRRLLESRVPLGWPHGYCAICGAWPLLAERRGLDRSRWLRCGRCGAGWEVQPLWCTFCGEQDHRKLGSLVPDGSGDMLKVDTCESCRGYLKSVATLQAIPPFELLLQDLETVELDLVAVERGYQRPERVAGHSA